MKSSTVISGVVIILLTASIILAGNCPTLVGQWNYGETRAIAAQDHFVFFSSGRIFIILDASDPANPKKISEVELPSAIVALAVRGTLACVGTQTDGLYMLDLSDTLHPNIVGQFAVTEDIVAIALAPTYAFIGTDVYDSTSHAHIGGLIILDVSDSVCPEQIWAGQYEFGQFMAMTLSEDDKIAFLAFRGNVVILDVTDATSPQQITAFEPDPKGVVKLAVDGSLLLLGMSNVGLATAALYDIYDATNPLRLGSYGIGLPDDLNGWGWLADVQIGDGSVYMLTNAGAFGYDNGLITELDISDPVSPMQTAQNWDDYKAFAKAALLGSSLWIAAYQSGYEDGPIGIQNFEVSDSSTLPKVSEYLLLLGSRGVAVSGSVAYFTDVGNGIEIVDVSEPAHPRAVKAVPWETPILDVSGHYLYAAGFGAFSIFDISNPLNPSLMGTCGVHASWPGLAIGSGWASLVDYDMLSVLDISDPTNPHVSATLPASDRFSDVAMKDTYVYLVGGSNDPESGFLSLLTISGFNGLTELGRIDTSYFLESVTVHGDYAYVLGGEGLSIMNISEPQNIFKIADLPLTLGAYQKMLYLKDRILISDYYDFNAVDVSDPFHPKLVSYSSNVGGNWMAVSGGLAFFPGWPALTVFDIYSCLAASPHMRPLTPP